MACLTSEMALVTWMPRGHASEQLKVVRQRHTPSLSFRISRRMSPASSRDASTAGLVGWLGGLRS